MYDKINKGDVNIACNILYRALQKQTIKELEVGMSEQPWGELDAMQFVHEAIDFSAYTREAVDHLYYYYINFGQRKFGMIYDSRRDTIKVYRTPPGQDINKGDPIIEISSETLHFIRDMIKEDHIYNQVS